jgi:hypothetical protein
MEGGAFVADYIPLQCVIDGFLLGYFSFSTTAQHKQHLFFFYYFPIFNQVSIIFTCLNFVKFPRAMKIRGFQGNKLHKLKLQCISQPKKNPKLSKVMIHISFLIYIIMK